MDTLAIIAQKGGAGKTTLTVHLAVCAALHGLKVAVIDLDHDQGSAHDWNESRPADRKFDAVKATAAELPGLLAKCETAGINLAIIDTAPHTTKEATEAAKLSDYVLIPCRPSRFDLRAIASTLVALQSTKTPHAVLINAAPQGFKLVEEARSQLAQTGVTVLPNVVHRWVALDYAVNSGESVHEFEPDGEAAAEIAKVYETLAGFLGLAAPPGAQKRRVATSV